MRPARRGARPTPWTRSSIRPGPCLPLHQRTAFDRPLDTATVDYWFPLDQYTRAVEHAILHLILFAFLDQVHARSWPHPNDEL